MAHQQIFEGTPAQLAGLLGNLSSGKRYRLVEVEESAEPLPKEQPAIDTENAAAIALLKLWKEQDATDDPEEIRKAEEELAEFKRNMNANREATDERLVYP